MTRDELLRLVTKQTLRLDAVKYFSVIKAYIPTVTVSFYKPELREKDYEQGIRGSYAAIIKIKSTKGETIPIIALYGAWGYSKVNLPPELVQDVGFFYDIKECIEELPRVVYVRKRLLDLEKRLSDDQVFDFREEGNVVNSIVKRIVRGQLTEMSIENAFSVLEKYVPKKIINEADYTVFKEWVDWYKNGASYKSSPKV